MGVTRTLRKMAEWLGLVEYEFCPACDSGVKGAHHSVDCPDAVRDLDPRIDQFVRLAVLHGLSPDERFMISTTPGERVGWTDNEGAYCSQRLDAQAIEVTSFVHHRYATVAPK